MNSYEFYFLFLLSFMSFEEIKLTVLNSFYSPSNVFNVFTTFFVYCLFKSEELRIDAIIDALLDFRYTLLFFCGLNRLLND